MLFIFVLNSVASLCSVTSKEPEGRDDHNHSVSAGLPILSKLEESKWTASGVTPSKSERHIQGHIGFSRVSLSHFYNKLHNHFTRLFLGNTERLRGI